MEARMILDADCEAGKISRHLYGHFSEHLGRCIYGGFWVGEDSKIPNRKGIRSDVVDALKALKVPNLRWPGGCFADEYHWTDGIGPRERRPSMVNTHWGGVTESNHFGTHEFMELCAQLGCEPYICGNVGSGTVREMSQWVEYLTMDGISPMSELRASNGRKEPWKVSLWGVGNENWGCGGSMRPEFYADLYRQYATYCRNYGSNKIFKIACGPNGADYNWTDALMRMAGDRMDALSLHHYTVPFDSWDGKHLASDFDESDWLRTMICAARMDELLTRHSAIMDKYDPSKKVALAVDEWGTWFKVEPGTNPGFLYQQNTLRDALVAGLTLNIFNRHSGRVRIANIAQTVNVLQAMILTEGERMLLTPSYHAFEMYKGHQDAIALPFHLKGPDLDWGKESVPQLSASASRSESGKILLTLCNLHPSSSLDVHCEARGFKGSKATARILTADDMHSHNTFERPDALKPAPYDEFKLKGGVLSLSMPSKSLLALELD